MSIDIIATVPRNQNVYHFFFMGTIFLLTVTNVRSYLHSNVGLHGSGLSSLQRGMTKALNCKSLLTPFSSFSLNAYAASSRGSNYKNENDNDNQKGTMKPVKGKKVEKLRGKITISLMDCKLRKSGKFERFLYFILKGRK